MPGKGQYTRFSGNIRVFYAYIDISWYNAEYDATYIALYNDIYIAHARTREALSFCEYPPCLSDAPETKRPCTADPWIELPEIEVIDIDVQASQFLGRNLVHQVQKAASGRRSRLARERAMKMIFMTEQYGFLADEESDVLDLSW